MTVAELITELVKLDKSGWTVDVRCPASDTETEADRDVTGVVAVMYNQGLTVTGVTDGWVTLGVEA